MRRLQGRHAAELVFPGLVIGLMAGGLAGGVAALGGLSAGYALTTMLTLGVPLGLAGMGYNVLLASGRLRLGGVAPAALYWLGAFPVARCLHEVFFDVASGTAIALPDAFVPFVTFQAIMSVGYAIGFVWMHEYVFSYWWIRVRSHNPVASRYVEQYTRQASRMQRREEPQGPR